MSAGDIGMKAKGKYAAPIVISPALSQTDNGTNNQWVPTSPMSIVTLPQLSVLGQAYAFSNTAVGYGATAEINASGSNGSIAIGSAAYALNGGVMIGNSYNYSTPSTHSYGSRGSNGVAIGTNTKTSSGVAIGFSASSASTTATAIGPYAIAQNTNAVAIGNAANAGGTQSIAIGYGSAISCSAQQTNSVAIGNGVTTDFVGELAYGSSDFSGNSGGGSKLSFFIAFFETTNATAAEVGTGGTGSTSQPSNRIVLTNDSSYIFNLDVVARNTTDDTQSAMLNVVFGIRRGTNAASTTLVGTPVKTIIGQDTGTTTWDVNVTADTTNGRPAIKVTGEAGKTIRWVITGKMTKVTG